MVALLIVLMFAVFIAADYMFNREKYRLPVVAESERNSTPSLLYFHPAHTWATAESNEVARVGLDAFAARLLPTPESVDAPKLARWVSQGARGFTLHYADREITLLSPVDGEVVEVNREAMANPTLLKTDPYGHGWLFKVRSPDMAVSFRNLLSADGMMHRWLEDCTDRLRAFFAPTELAVAQDGGPMVDSLAGRLTAEQWKTMTTEFFRS